jgi:hypothetical protein
MRRRGTSDSGHWLPTLDTEKADMNQRRKIVIVGGVVGGAPLAARRRDGLPVQEHLKKRGVSPRLKEGLAGIARSGDLLVVSSTKGQEVTAELCYALQYGAARDGKETAAGRRSNLSAVDPVRNIRTDSSPYSKESQMNRRLSAIWLPVDSPPFFSSCLPSSREMNPLPGGRSGMICRPMVNTSMSLIPSF